MFIAHLPAGYITSRLLIHVAKFPATPAILMAGMIGGIVPDIDLLYGALIDGGSIHHHRYWTHLPLIWLCLHAGTMLILRGEMRRLTSAFLLAGWSHLLLDSVAGDIWWLWPWLDQPFSLVDIPARFSTWWLNFLLHWSFLLELTIAGIAVWLESTRPVLPRFRQQQACPR